MKEITEIILALVIILLSILLFCIGVLVGREQTVNLCDEQTSLVRQCTEILEKQIKLYKE